MPQHHLLSQDPAHRLFSARRASTRGAVLAGALALVVGSLAACGASDPGADPLGPTAKAGQSSPAGERAALVDLYRATDGPGWTDHTGWDETDDFCTWYGVTCEDGHVTELDLHSNELSGSVPDSIGDLTGLTYLGLFDNQLDAVPQTIGNLTNLTVLFLHENQLTSVPETIGNLTRLTRLELGENQLTSVPETVGNLTDLDILYLEYNQLASVPESIGNLTSLTELNLSNNQHIASVPESIGNLTSLTYMALSGNRITALPESITNLDSLTSLYLASDTCFTPSAKVAAWLDGIDKVDGWDGHTVC